MVMENKKNEIDLQTVVDRFRQAEENLHRTTDEVKKIILNSDIAKESSDSIKNSSQKLTQFAESLNKSISEISGAVGELRGSLQAAAKFMEKTDLSEINKTVKSLSSELASKQDILDVLEKLKSMEKVNKKNSEAIKNILGSLPGRWKNKLSSNDDVD